MKVSIMCHTVTVKILCGNVTSAVQYSFRLFHAMSRLYSYSRENRNMSFMAKSRRGCNYSEICLHIEGNAVLVERRDLIFDTPGSSSKWVDRPVPSLCRAPLPVPHHHWSQALYLLHTLSLQCHSADCCIHQNHCLWKTVSQFKYCHASFVYPR
jgi:hypothetical protein